MNLFFMFLKLIRLPYKEKRDIERIRITKLKKLLIHSKTHTIANTVQAGAHEVDVVINLNAVKSHQWDFVKEELKSLNLKLTKINQAINSKFSLRNSTVAIRIHLLNSGMKHLLQIV